MQLDPLTLMVPNAFAAAVAGVLLFGAWWLQPRPTRALLLWASSNFVIAAGLTLLIIGIASNIRMLVLASPGLILISHALTWMGVRSFHHRPAPIGMIAAGLVIWLVVCFLSTPDTLYWSTLTSFAAAAIFLIAAAFDLRRERSEKLGARWPLTALFSLHAAVFLAGVIDVLLGKFIPGQPPSFHGVFWIIHFENVLYTMSAAIFMILLCKDRLEAHYINVARIDALTGVNNRGTTFVKMGRLLNKCRHSRAPLSIIMFDLDHFKSINDTHGHQFGDGVLCAFTDTARTVLRPKDVIGRYGGEEFIVALPGASIEMAAAIAQQVRTIFAENHYYFEGRLLEATVSAGVATISAGQSLESGIEAADQALYAAKNAGRNRVMLAEAMLVPETVMKIVHVA